MKFKTVPESVPSIRTQFFSDSGFSVDKERTDYMFKLTQYLSE